MANQEAEDARRRRALDSVDALFDANARARELVAWLMGAPPPVPRGRLRRNQLVTAGQLIQKIWRGGGGGDRGDLKMELIKLFRGLYAGDNPENVVEAEGYLSEAMMEVDTQEVKVLWSWLLDMMLGRADQEEENKKGESSAGKELLMDILKALKGPMANFIVDAEVLRRSVSVPKAIEAMGHLVDMFKALKEPMEKFLGLADQPQQGSSSSANKDDDSEQAADHAATPSEDLLEKVKAAKEPMELARAEARYVAAQVKWLLGMFFSDKFSLRQEHAHHPKVVSIVTPPAVEDLSNDLLEETHGTELAKKVFDHPSTSDHFDTKVWVDAKNNPDLKPRLMSILHQVRLTSPAASSSDNKSLMEPTEDETSQWKAWSEHKLKTRISKCLKGKKFLIVLADPEDENAWQDITSALSDHGDGCVIETPRIKYMAQFHAWYWASWMFLLTGASSRYQVHFCSNLVGIRKVASELVGSDQLPGGIGAILKKCLWDSFATKMFLHALYVNPHRSDAELERLMLGLRYSSSVSNGRRMVQFCYEDLPRQHQSCLLSLSIFPHEEGRTFKRTSLVRRWAAENFISARGGLAAVDEADRCFDALVARGLLQPADIGPAGKVKSCTVHRHVHSFITKMDSYHIAVDNNMEDLRSELAHRLSTRSGILQLLLENQQAAANYSTCWGMTIHRHHHNAPSRDSPHEVVTLLNLLPASSDQLGLVKLLDLEGCKGLKKRHLKKICNKIFQLKYLSLRNTDATELPKEINKLRYLETLDIRQTKIKSFPANTIALPKLMHLLAGRTDHESTEAMGSSDNRFSTVHLPGQIGSMTNVQVLSHVQVSETESDTSELTNVGRKLHLRKLGVVIRGKNPLGVLLRVIGMLHESLCSLSVHLEPMEAEGEVYSMEPEAHGGNAFEIPKSLESLNIKGEINELPTWTRQLYRLSKITLCRTSLREGDIHKLGELANLRCIRLLHQSYTNKKLTFNTNQFRKLELLVIQDSGIYDIHFGKNAAPGLKKIIWNFTSAEITLSGIQELLNLKEIHVGGNCDESHLSKIQKDITKNPNLPVLYPPIHTKPKCCCCCRCAATSTAATGAAATASSSNASILK